MKNLIYAFWIVFYLTGNTLMAQNHSETELLKFEENKLYVKYKTSPTLKIKGVEGSRTIISAQLPKIQGLIQKYGIHPNAFSMSLFEDEILSNTVQIRFDSSQKISTLIEELEKNPNVEYVERIPLYRLLSTTNDPFAKEVGGRNLKWHLDLIRAQEAWEIQKASPNIRVAIVDNAVWGAHEDLQIAAENQYNVAEKKRGNSAPPSIIEQDKECTNLSNCPAYRWSHGTHCAGIAGGINNNEKGISSIGSGVTLMGVSLEGLPGSPVTDAFDGILWAAENGAHVISCSWGSGALNKTQSTILRACHQKGVILVFASGNSSSSGLNYPAASPYVISVGSVNSDKAPASSSNYGYWVDIAAPGGFEVNAEGKETKNGILSTTFCKNQNYRLNAYSELTGLYYDGMAGTSMAAPMVAGLVGFLLSKDSTLNTTLMKDLLMQSGQSLNYTNSKKLFNAEASVIDAKGALDYMETAKIYPSKLRAVLKNENVHIDWEAPTQTKEIPTHYRLYRNRELIDTCVLECAYIDLEMEKGEYEYAVQAVFKDNSMSLKNGVGISVDFYTIDVDIQPRMGGKIENYGKMPQNQIVELIAHPNPNYKFVAWKVEDEIISQDTILSILLTQDTALIAEFKTYVSNENRASDNSTTFYVSPNPANKQISILSNETDFDYISILNLIGNEVLRINRPTSKSILIESLSQGLYFLHAEKENRKYVAKFIKK